MQEWEVQAGVYSCLLPWVTGLGQEKKKNRNDAVEG